MCNKCIFNLLTFSEKAWVDRDVLQVREIDSPSLRPAGCLECMNSLFPGQRTFSTSIELRAKTFPSLYAGWLAVSVAVPTLTVDAETGGDGVGRRRWEVMTLVT